MEPVVVHHFLLCRRASYDFGDAVAPYTLHNVVFHLGPGAGETYPLDGIDLWVFVRLEGDDEHEFWVEVVRLASDDEDDEELVTTYGPLIVPFGAERIPMSRAWKLRNVQFSATGWYEFRVTSADEILAVQQIYLGE